MTVKFDGDRFATLIEFVEKNQMLDDVLWRQTVNQFKVFSDDVDDGWRGEFWGKLMRGACSIYSYTKNEQLYGLIADSVQELLSLRGYSGRISSYSTANEFCGWDVWCRKYVMFGLLYFADICKDSAAKAKVLDALSAHADYIIAKLGDSKNGKIPITQTSEHWLGMNSCSILQPFVWLYNRTKQKRYLDFAEHIIACGFSSGENLIDLALKNKLMPHQYPVTKAYEMISCFEGLLEYYKITGSPQHLIACVNFADAVLKSDFTIIGASGLTHELFDNSSYMQTQRKVGVMLETCVTVTLIKYLGALFTETKDSRYIDAVEISLYNAYMGAVNFEKVTANGGFLFDSYSPLIAQKRGRLIGGFKCIDTKTNRYYGCCAAIGGITAGMLPSFCVAQKDNTVAVNLYFNGQFDFCIDDKTVLINQSTKYPDNGHIEFTVVPEDKTEFSLALRLPKWCKSHSLSLNETKIEYIVSKGYIVIKREWKADDKLILSLDMPMVFYGSKNTVKEDQFALCKGPIVFAADERLSDLHAAYQPIVNSDGTVAFEPMENDVFNSAQCYNVLLENGKKLKVVDYAGAGLSWSDAAKLSVWMNLRESN